MRILRVPKPLRRPPKPRAKALAVTLFLVGAVVLPASSEAGSGGGWTSPRSGPSTSASLLQAPPLQPIDPQVWEDQQDMTWDDYRSIPNTNWVDPAGVPTVRGLRIALVAIDFPDQPFVITMPKQSDLFGNPQIDPIPRAQVPQFYTDHFMQPGPINHGHTIHEYWMEQSRGRLGVTEVVPFGPYLMPRPLYEYGLNEFGQTGACPSGHTCNGSMDSDANTIWRAANGGCTGNCGFDVVMRIYAGYDETSVWQEFGEMMFQTQNDIPDEWGNPDPTKPNWAPTRYVPWTSWKAAAQQWGQASIRQGESSGTITHEMAHFFFSIGDNNNNPFATPYHRVGAAPWDIMDRGSFNGPGGHHMRWVVPVNMGGWMPAGVMVRNKITMGFLPETHILRLNRDALGLSGLVVAKVTARAVDPGTGGKQAGIHIVMADRTPPCDTATDPYCHGNTWDQYTVEVVQRIGYDSFTPDSGVLISKNKTAEGSTCGYNCFNWVIDAHPEDMNMVDYYKPDGTPVMRTVADHRQLNDALFHAGLNSGSQYEWEDTPNGLHFYVVDRETDSDGVITYTIGVQNPTTAGPQTRGVAVANTPPVGVVGLSGYCNFPVTNTGTPAPVNPPIHPEDVTAYLNNDVYRLSATAEGSGWNAQLANALATAAFGSTVTVPVYVTRDFDSALTGTIRLTATSVSDATKTSTGTCSVSAQPTAVALGSFSARRTGGRTVMLHWRTGAEAGLLGFELYRGRVRLTKTPIRARRVTGASYTYIDRRVKRVPVSYRLQAVKLDGSRVLLGSVGVR